MKQNRKIIYLAGFLFSMPIALMSYINSSFLSSFVNGKLMGVTYALGSVASILALLTAPTIFRKFGGYKFLLFVIGFDALSILSFALAKNAWVALLAFILGFALNTVIIFSLDEILKIFSKNSSTGKTRGTYLAVSSAAWILAQLVSGTILGEFSFRMIYLTAFSIMILFFLLCLFKLRDIPDPEYDKLKIVKYIKEFFKNKNRRRS